MEMVCQVLMYVKYSLELELEEVFNTRNSEFIPTIFSTVHLRPTATTHASLLWQDFHKRLVVIMAVEDRKEVWEL